MNVADLPQLAELLPHRGRVLLLDRVLDHDEESTTVRVVVDRSSWLARDDGSVPAWVALEYMAQTIAAHETVCALLEGRPPVRGAVASASGLRLPVDDFAHGDPLRVRTRRLRGRPGLGAITHECEIHAESPPDRLLASGRLSIAIPRPKL